MTNNIECDFFSDTKLLIESRLKELVFSQDPFSSALFESARYSLLAKSKRIRPLLALCIVKSFSANPLRALDPACALELIHTYSLIHDDLPCMDDSPFRRDQPSLHTVAGDGHAVLVGDFLLTYAFEILADSLCTPIMKVELVKTLAYAAGGLGMVGGQAMDLLMMGNSLSLTELEKIHHHKTGALFIASFQFGGILSCASPQQMNILYNLGQILGLLFQIVDDIKDDANDKTGKVAINYVSLLGIDVAKDKVFQLANTFQKSLKTLEIRTNFLEYILQQILLPIQDVFHSLKS